jgi:asparagine synthase (glutamine-hydrolysing)
MGNGLKLYGDSVSWRAPFLSQDWITVVWNLPYSWKLGSNWHRFCIKKNYPQLLDFPEPEAAIMAERAAPRYWFPSRYKKRHPQIPYAKYQEWYQQDFFITFMKENALVLSELINPKLVTNILREHKEKGNRTKAIAWLLNMLFWLRRIKEYIQ